VAQESLNHIAETSEKLVYYAYVLPSRTARHTLSVRTLDLANPFSLFV
jgi:hypothetical protein